MTGCVCKTDGRGHVTRPCAYHAPDYYARQPYVGNHGHFPTMGSGGTQGWHVTLKDGSRFFTYITKDAISMADTGSPPTAGREFMSKVEETTVEGVAILLVYAFDGIRVRELNGVDLGNATCDDVSQVWTTFGRRGGRIGISPTRDGAIEQIVTRSRKV